MKKLFLKLLQIQWKKIISELLLIVVGILIALYINNLNERSKERDFEQIIVAEIEKSLRSDLENHIKNRITRGIQIIQSADIVLDYLEDKIAYHDSLETHFWRLNWIMIFEPKTIPFERLKSKGIEILSKEEVRLQLLELYDYNYPRISYFTQDFNEWTTNRIEPYNLKHFKIKNLKRGKGYEPLDKEDLKNDIEYRNMVIEKRAIINGLKSRMELTQTNVEYLLEQLEKH